MRPPFSPYSPEYLERLSGKWFEQRFGGEFAGIRASDRPKTSRLDSPKDLAIKPLGTFQTVSSRQLGEYKHPNPIVRLTPHIFY